MFTWGPDSLTQTAIIYILFYYLSYFTPAFYTVKTKNQKNKKIFSDIVKAYNNHQLHGQNSVEDLYCKFVHKRLK